MSSSCAWAASRQRADKQITKQGRESDSLVEHETLATAGFGYLGILPINSSVGKGYTRIQSGGIGPSRDAEVEETRS